MLLREMFSAIGAPNEMEQDVDWINDLKFFIDNDTEVLSKEFFPAIKKHKEVGDHPNAYKLYIQPILRCKDNYVKQFEIEEAEVKFPKGDLIGLAKQFAEEQKQHITDGNYEN